MKKAKTIGGSPKQKVRHNSSLQDNLELFLALKWPKQLSCNTQTRVYQQPKHTINDSNIPQFKQGKLGQRHTQFLNITAGQLTQSQQGRSQQVWESTTHQHPRAHKATHNSSMQTLRKVTHPQSKVEAEFGLTTASQIMGKQQQPKTYTATHSQHGKKAQKVCT